ncbi:MAG: M61 family metallopeptidase [Gammaproteobacteria bacterium]|nr:M61 family metallopeptidase [Gammaproteobacteria bacterium]MBV8402570.1 M61 family metallopeptidase [Gammaproteobacteria bacterium]
MSSGSATASERAPRRALRWAARALRGSLAGLAALALAAGAAAAPAGGTAQLQVDARAAPRGILKMHLVLPVQPGPLTLVYPKWLPGRHGPAGPITDLAGPVLHAGAQRIAWHRDEVDMYAFHLEVPAGVTTIEADFEVLTSPRPDGTVNGLEAPRTATDWLAIIEWHQTVLYPADSNTDELEYQAEVRLPAGWKYATALTPLQQGPESVRFEPTTLTTLVDSTLLAGRYLESFDLGGSPPVRLHIAADSPAALELSAEKLSQYRRLVAEAHALFGPGHYRHYDFLYALTDQIMPDGLEHHESSDNRSPYRTFLDDDVRRAEANLLPHEYTHSWNGKYRRPVGLATRNYQDPMRTGMLWVYEGLTEYLGDVLAARSGLLTAEEFRSELAHDFAGLQTHQARAWRSLEDTTVAAQLLYVQPRDWAARLRRQEDFYHESALLWLEADTLIRRLSGGRRSLDDFCARFLGGEARAPAVKPYDFEDVLSTLAAVQPYDWRRFWNERIQRAGAELPVTGLVQSGWKPELSAEPSVMHRAHEADDRDLDLRFSLGFYVEDDGTLVDIIPGSPADTAGLASLERLAAVDGRRWSKEELRDALTATLHGKTTVTLLLEKDNAYRSIDLHYDGGPREPRLVRVPGGPDLLSLITQSRAPATH